MNRDATQYSPRVRDLFARLPGADQLAAGAGAIFSGEAIALDRGAWVRFEARVDGARIADCVFRAWGCPHTLAASAWVASKLRGREVESCSEIDALQMARELEAPAEKMGRLLIVEDALRALLREAGAVQ
ncbi:MAG: iron-sulfur cluster assembly scaffold protein [Steroidobacteraceae bacterium]